MATWTLILLTYIGNSGQAIQVPGFTSLAQCKAAYRIVRDEGAGMGLSSVRGACVKVGG